MSHHIVLLRWDKHLSWFTQKHKQGVAETILNFDPHTWRHIKKKRETSAGP